jgi:type II secretory pathway pseudopilin PulG
MSAGAPQRGGFTLLETLAVVAITAFLVAAIVGIYIGIVNNTERATDATREVRVATAVLDRVARDLQGAYVLVRDEADDPLSHPWLFKAETRAGQLGADRVMFTTLSHSSRGRSDERAQSGGIATYAYWLEGDEEAGYDLVRSVQPRLPEDHSFPSEQDEGAMVVAEGLESFSLHFLDDFGSWNEAWDSTALVDSSELPAVVEVRLSLPPPLEGEELELLEEFGETFLPREYRRRVVLYQRPLTREAALGQGGQTGGGEEEGIEFWDDPPCSLMTWAECFARQPQELLDARSPELKRLHDTWLDKCVPEDVRFGSGQLEMARCR